MPTFLTRKRQNAGWAELHDPTDECPQSVVPDEFTPRYINPKGPLGLYVLTDSESATGGLYYSADALAATPTITKKQDITGYHLLRLERGGPGHVAAYGVEVSVATGGVTVDFDSGWANYSITYGSIVPGGNPGNCLAAVSPATTRVKIRVDLGEETTITGIKVDAYREDRSGLDDIGIQTDGFDSGLGAVGQSDLSGLGPPNMTWTTYTLTPGDFPWPGVQYVDIQVSGGNIHEVRMDNIVISTTQTTTQPAFSYSSDYGDTISTQQVGSGTLADTGGMDCDDGGDGIVIAVGAATDSALYYTDYDYTGAFTKITGVPDSGSGVEYNLVRIPYKRFSDSQFNNDGSQTAALWGANGTVAGASLWRGSFNTSTGTMSGTVDITPTINGTTYCVAAGYGEQVEVQGANPNRIMGCFRPVAGGDNAQLYSYDAGANWSLVGSYDCFFTRWSTVGNKGVWLAGSDGIIYSPDRGQTWEDRTGDYTSTNVGGSTPVYGVFPVG